LAGAYALELANHSARFVGYKYNHNNTNNNNKFQTDTKTYNVLYGVENCPKIYDMLIRATSELSGSFEKAISHNAG